MSSILNGTTLRINNPEVSVEFYKNNFGFELLKTDKYDNFDLYSLGIRNSDEKEPYAKQGVVHLLHNNIDRFVPDNGNGEHKGFGHLCVSVDNIDAAEKKLLANGVKFQKKLADGRQKDIAFALDPDNYWIELIEHGINKKEGTTDLRNNRFNHTMIRVRNPEESVEFYKGLFGLKLLSKREFESAKFTLYFLAFDDELVTEGSVDKKTQAAREGILELTHNWGTELDKDFRGYYTGNENPKGFSNITVSVVGLPNFAQRAITKLGEDKVKVTDEVVEVHDPDGYLVKVVEKA